MYFWINVTCLETIWQILRCVWGQVSGTTRVPWNVWVDACWNWAEPSGQLLTPAWSVQTGLERAGSVSEWGTPVTQEDLKRQDQHTSATAEGWRVMLKTHTGAEKKRAEGSSWMNKPLVNCTQINRQLQQAQHDKLGHYSQDYCRDILGDSILPPKLQ